MSYAIVEFTASKEVEIVPTTWVTGSVCVWPHNVKAEKAGKMAKKQHPPQSWWKQYEIAVKGLFVTYEHARKKLNDIQFDSDLASETEMPPLKRRRRPPAVWSDSDGEEEEEDSATSQPGLPPIPNNFPSGITSSEATSMPTFGQGDKGTAGTQLSETNSPQGEQTAQERPRNSPHDCCVEKNFQRHVLRLLNTLRFMLEQQADTLNKLCDMLPTSSVTECAELLGHPLSSLEELQEFDDKLDAGKFKILVHELAQLGGKDAYWATKRILSYCITDEVAAQFSWRGRKGKLSFSALKIAKAITDAARKAPNATAADVEASIKSWLRHAPERLATRFQKSKQGQLEQAADTD
ncbi:uncharacterized protein LOC119395592 isoform X2 [Rhipicephalus sanguineus]|uniref:uncharacterized protein LOC119395592 isoform X2 n=1 Tax=Rhipicephalus sanguineus TaxID=34632 RepID=UPI0020C2D92B|nr:uncharacterized protein LOC119395592 isoform X2 [Rhipicephalus sanguineus]